MNGAEMKTKIVAVALLLAGMLLSASPASAGAVMDHIIAKGELRVGTSGQQPPMTAVTKKGDVIGLDADIARAMADAMKVEVNFVVMPFSELLPALEAGRIDMVISGMTMTAGRNMQVAFVGPYYVSGKGILARAERFATLKEAKGLNTPEVTVAALKGGTSQAFAERLMPRAKRVLTASYDEALALLFADKVDVMVADFPFCALTAYRHKDKRLHAGSSPLTFEPLGVAMAEDALLINWTRNFLTHLQGTGELKKLHDKWLSGGDWVNELP
jgi:polar amino acid transport system substrate-binding protein